MPSDSKEPSDFDTPKLGLAPDRDFGVGDAGGRGGRGGRHDLPKRCGVDDEPREIDGLGDKETSEAVAAQPERQPCTKKWLVAVIHLASMTVKTRHPSSQTELCDHRLPTLGA